MPNKSTRIGIFAIIACMLIVQSAQFSYSEDDARKKAEEITKKIQKEIDALKTDWKNKKKIWDVAKNATDTAKITYKQIPTAQNLSALNLAKKTESDTYQNYLKALKTLQDFKPNLEEAKIEKAEKNNSPTKTNTISDARKKAQEISEKIQKELDKAKQDLDTATTTWNNTKVAKDSAKLIYQLNPTQQNLDILWNAKKVEAEALFFYFKAISDVREFKIKLDDIS